MRFPRLLALSLLSVGAARAQAPAPVLPPQASPEAQAAAAPPYLQPADEPDTAAVLPPPPAAGSAAASRDADAFVRTRALRGGPRWRLAANDDDLGAGPLLADFSCAAGLVLDPVSTPTFARLVARVEADAKAVTDRAKTRFARVRPQVGNDLPICVARRPGLDRSPSYPSGHTTIGWAVALVAADLLPDRAVPLIARGRAFGESRIVCGVHWASDVRAGRRNAGALLARLAEDPGFRADRDAARAELAVRRGHGTVEPASAACGVGEIRPLYP